MNNYAIQRCSDNKFYTHSGIWSKNPWLTDYGNIEYVKDDLEWMKEEFPKTKLRIVKLNIKISKLKCLP